MSNHIPLAPGEYTIQYGSRNLTLYGGWKDAPDGRGTIDIVWSCALTIFLSSWSILCLNLPAEHEGFWHRMRRKVHWFMLTVLGPEVLFQLAFGEWLKARRSCKAFREMEHHAWTMTHSFYANMGGVILLTHDAGSFPVNAEQLHYLYLEGHMSRPVIARKAILDKNKAEPLVRAITLVQILWFLMQCIGRAIQGLALTALELSTIAFISSAVGTFLCWFHKPMDVETPVTIQLDTPVAAIQAKAGHLHTPWSRTPLDFIHRRREWPWNIYWRWGLAVMTKKMHMSSLILRPKQRPDTFRWNAWLPHM